ncbi:hypothetical protein [uncultured Roseobacter sp.]|uniref:hypothetical protein n=1 Tax=uncultured Roseobacter sp. TaxID=114847 RepID=UPI0026109E70|nr:hypothetical protein [uncultured Roseobacter sp.]
MTEGKDSTIAVSTIADALGLTQEVTVDKMLAFNASKQLEILPEKPLNEKTIRNAQRDGVKLRQEGTREWLRAFMSWVIGQTTHGNKDIRAIREILAGLEALKKPVKAKAKKLKRTTTTELDAFARDIVDHQKKFPGLQEDRFRLAGYYRLIRKTSQNGLVHYYEEPLFVGTEDQRSWLASARQGAAWGFTTVTSGILVLVLNHKDARTNFGFRVIKMDFARGNPNSGYPAIMLRISDNSSVPAVSRVVLTRVDDADPDIERWNSTITDDDRAFDNHEIGSMVDRIDGDHPMHSAYEQLAIGEHLTIAEPVEWETAEAVLKSINGERASRQDR